MNNFKFPLLAITHNSIYAARNEKDILICSKIALENNFYKGLKIIDSTGTFFYISNARKLRGHGLFWEYNIFLNQKIEVELFIETQNEISLKDFKKILISNLNKDFWDSGDNLKEILIQINSLGSIDLIINFITTMYYNEN